MSRLEFHPLEPSAALGAAYLTDHGQLLCSGCVDRNKGQLARAGIGLVMVPCHGIVDCTLCGRSASEN